MQVAMAESEACVGVPTDMGNLDASDTAALLAGQPVAKIPVLPVTERMTDGRAWRSETRRWRRARLLGLMALYAQESYQSMLHIHPGRPVAEPDADGGSSNPRPVSGTPNPTEAAMVATLHRVLSDVPTDSLPPSTLSSCEASTVLGYHGLTLHDADGPPPLIPCYVGGAYVLGPNVPKPRRLRMTIPALETFYGPLEDRPVAVVPIMPDGHCMFRSIAVALGGAADGSRGWSVESLREIVAGSVGQHQFDMWTEMFRDAVHNRETATLHEFAFVAGVRTLDELRSVMMGPRYWGDHFALQTFQAAFGVRIRVVDMRGQIVATPSYEPEFRAGRAWVPTKPMFEILLRYDGVHYDLLLTEGMRMRRFCGADAGAERVH